MKQSHIKTLIALGYGISLAVLKGGTIIQSIYSKQGFMPLMVSATGLALSGMVLPTNYYKQVKASYKVTTVVNAVYQTYKSFGATHTKYIAPKYKKFYSESEGRANNKVHKIYLFDSLAHLGDKAADTYLTIELPIMIADKAVTITNVLTSGNPLGLASIVAVTYGVVIASGDIITNNPVYSYVIKATGLLLPAIFLPMFVPPVYKDKIQLVCQITTVIKNSYIIHNAVQKLQHPGVDQYDKKYYQTEVDKLLMFKGMSKIKNILTADKLYQLDKTSEISLSSMDLVSTTIIMPMFINKIAETIWGNVDSALSFSLFAIRGEYSPIVAAIYIGSGLLLGLNKATLTADPAYLFIPLFALVTPAFNYKQIKTTYKIAILVKATDKIVDAIGHFEQIGVFAGNKTFEEVVKDDQFAGGGELAVSAAGDIIVKDYLVFSVTSAIMSFIGVDNPID